MDIRFICSGLIEGWFAVGTVFSRRRLAAFFVFSDLDFRIGPSKNACARTKPPRSNINLKKDTRHVCLFIALTLLSP